jgi:uncharacterized protein YqjF (DUF2071 family)
VLDRITPTYRPVGWPIGFQRWHSLLFLHWPVPTAALRPLVPAALDLDLWDGVAYLGLVPFAVEQARPVGAPARLALGFLETNVRTYVHLRGRGPGVYFFSLDAASRLAVAGARLGFGLPYYHARMRMRAHDGVADYAMQRIWGPPGALTVRYQVGEYVGPSAPGTLEHFLIERYLLYAPRYDGLRSTQVHHRPYPVYHAHVLHLQESLFAADGLPSAPGPPPLVHYASLVDVDVYAPRRPERYAEQTLAAPSSS